MPRLGDAVLRLAIWSAGECPDAPEGASGCGRAGGICLIGTYCGLAVVSPGRGRARRLGCMQRLGVLRQEGRVHGLCRFERGRHSVTWFEPFPGTPPDQPEPWSSSRERGPWTLLGPRDR